jgi:chromosomal replication initiation ATPase DnaA
MAMYLCRLVFAMKLSQVGEAFGRDRKTVHHALLRVEELREDYEFDRAMSLLEAGLSRGRA